MPTTSSATTSQRLLHLLSLLQTRRDWPGPVLSDRLEVSDRTLRRDVDRLRELGYPVRATKGPDGGYRLDAGTQLPPLLFDDDQAVALAVALGGAVSTGAGIEEDALRALATVRQVMPARLRARIDAFEMTAVPTTARGAAPQVSTGVLLAVGAAVRAREELRFDYGDADDGPPRQVQPHHLVARAGRWYLVARLPRSDEWRTYRVDRIRPRTPNGPRFVPGEVPGGDVRAFVNARFKGSAGADAWPCTGEAVLSVPAAAVGPFVGDGTV